MNTLTAIPLVDLGAQYRRIRGEIDPAIQRVLDHHGFILGEEVDAFERALAEYVECDGCVGVASGTAALRLALQALDVGPGDEVVTVSHTFFATGEAISQLGARPRFVDVEPDTLTMDPGQVEEVIRVDRELGGGKVKAIVPVHLYGQPADMDALTDISVKYEVPIVEDAAQAHGAEWRGNRCGSLGTLACFSFYPGKNLGAYGDAGAVTGDDPALLDRIRRLRDHGRVDKYEHLEIGWGERLDALQAAVLQVKLRHLEEWTDARRRIASDYRARLEGLEIDLPVERPEARHVYHLFVIRSALRDELLEHLREEGIGAGVHYPIPLHRQPAYRREYGQLQLPHTERAAGEVISLPLFPELPGEHLERVCRSVTQFMEGGPLARLPG